MPDAVLVLAYEQFPVPQCYFGVGLIYFLSFPASIFLLKNLPPKNAARGIRTSTNNFSGMIDRYISIDISCFIPFHVTKEGIPKNARTLFNRIITGPPVNDCRMGTTVLVTGSLSILMGIRGGGLVATVLSEF